jgi:hypothetical protein
MRWDHQQIHQRKRDHHALERYLYYVEVQFHLSQLVLPAPITGADRAGITSLQSTCCVLAGTFLVNSTL